jgi:hypothetical protein
LRGLKATCKSSEFRNKDFWKHVQKVGRKLSLISDTEAETNDGISDVTDRAALQVSIASHMHRAYLPNIPVAVHEVVWLTFGRLF